MCSKLLLINVLLAATLLAQDANRTQPGTLPNEADRAVPTSSSTVEPLTVKEKFRYRFRHTIDPLNIVLSAATAGLDHWRRYPDEWGTGWDAYGARFASSYGQHIIGEQLMFAVEAVDHEDPRRPHPQATTFKGRMWEAIKFTFVVQRDGGGWMPAYSRFVADFGTAAISRYGWYPAEFHNFQNVIDIGFSNLGTDLGMNMLRELLHRNN